MKLWILTLFVGLSWAAPMTIESVEDIFGIGPNPVEEPPSLPQPSSNSIKKTSDKKPADAETTPGDDDEHDQFKIDVEAVCGANSGAIRPEQIEPLIMAFEALWNDVHSSTGLTPEEYSSYISFILNRNKTKEERLAEVKEFVQTIVSGPETQEGDNAEALALNNAAGILIDLTDFLRAGAADNEENPFAIIADLLTQMLINLPEITPVNRENTKENICAYMAEFIRQLKKNIRIELPSKEAKTKGSDDEGKIAAKESGSNNKEVPKVTVGDEEEAGPPEKVPKVTGGDEEEAGPPEEVPKTTVGDEEGSGSTKVKPKTTTNNGTDVVEEPSAEGDDMGELDVPQNGTTIAQPPAESPEVVHTGAVSDDGVMGIIEEIIVDVFGDKAPEPQTHSNATEQPEVSAAPEEDVAEIANGDEEPEPQTHTNATKQPEVSPASEGNVTEITTTQEPEPLLGLNLLEEIIDEMTSTGERDQ